MYGAMAGSGVDWEVAPLLIQGVSMNYQITGTPNYIFTLPDDSQVFVIIEGGVTTRKLRTLIEHLKLVEHHFAQAEIAKQLNEQQTAAGDAAKEGV